MFKEAGWVYDCYRCKTPLVKLVQDVKKSDKISVSQFEFLVPGWKPKNGEKMECPICQAAMAVGSG